jgi:hypothetical protein
VGGVGVCSVWTRAELFSLTRLALSLCG